MNKENSDGDREISRRVARRYAIVVGVSKYRDPYVSSLEYAHCDAVEMIDCLVGNLGFDQAWLYTAPESRPKRDYGGKVSVESLYTGDADDHRGRGGEDSGRSVTLDEVFGQVDKFLRTQMDKSPENRPRADDELWFFFSGHGIIRDQRYYLIPPGPKNVRSPESDEFWEFDEVRRRLMATRIGRCVLVVDACRDCEGGRTVGTEDPNAEAPFDRKIVSVAKIQEEERNRGQGTFYSCAWGSKSFEFQQLTHGSFTYALVEYLNSRSSDGHKTLETVQEYLQHRVPKLNEDCGKPTQIPAFSPDPIGAKNYPVPEPVGTLPPGAICMAKAVNSRKETFFNQPLRVAFYILSLVIVLLLAGKVVRGLILREEQILYYAKFLEVPGWRVNSTNRDADLALWWNDVAKAGAAAVDMSATDFREVQWSSRLMRYHQWAQSLTPDERERYVSNWKHLEEFARQFRLPDHRDESEEALLYRIEKGIDGKDKLINDLGVDYGGFDHTWLLVRRTLEERLDDGPFGVALGFVLFFVLASNSVRRALSSIRARPQAIPTLGMRGVWLGLVPGTIVVGMLFQIGHPMTGDYGPLHGTFWVEWFRPRVAWTQVADGIIYLFWGLGLVGGLIWFLWSLRTLIDFLKSWKLSETEWNAAVEEIRLLLFVPLVCLVAMMLYIAFINFLANRGRGVIPIDLNIHPEFFAAFPILFLAGCLCARHWLAPKYTLSIFDMKPPWFLRVDDRH